MATTTEDTTVEFITENGSTGPMSASVIDEAAKHLRYMEPVTVTLVDRHGEVVGEAPATVGYPGFKDHFDKSGGKTVERVHTATLD